MYPGSELADAKRRDLEARAASSRTAAAVERPSSGGGPTAALAAGLRWAADAIDRPARSSAAGC